MSAERLAELMQSGDGSQAIDALIDETDLHAHPDHPVDVVLERLGQSGGLLPIVSRDQAQRVEGVVTSESVVQFISRQRRTSVVPAKETSNA